MTNTKTIIVKSRSYILDPPFQTKIGVFFSAIIWQRFQFAIIVQKACSGRFGANDRRRRGN